MASRAGNHIEVVPRILDAKIAPVYVSSKTSDVVEAVQPTMPTKQILATQTSPTVTATFFKTLADYAIPIGFVIAVFIVIYVIWTYWTTRTANEPQAVVAPVNEPPSAPHSIDGGLSSDSLSNDELSKYLNDDTTDDEGDDCETLDSNEERSVDEEEDEERSDEDEEDEEEPQMSIDLDEITKLIHEPIEEDLLPSRFEIINEDLFESTPTDVPDLINESNEVIDDRDHDDIPILEAESIKPIKTTRGRRNKSFLDL